MGVIGEEFILVRPETTGFVAKLKSSLLGEAGGLNIAGTLVGASVVAGVGVGLFAIGEKFESTYNQIRVKTGATGKVFEGLKDDVKNVLSQTAGSFDQVGAAISGIYARTGLTGAALDNLAKQQVVLGRITKSDVGENVDATTKLFAKYGISARDQGKYLDILFKASQQAGVGITDIIAPMQKGGAALQQFGFGFSQSAALIASLTKAGVNVQPALMSLRTAFGKIAKEGGDPVKVFRNLQQALTDGKNPVKAMGEAMSLLGNRGGLELANAIKQGRFNLDGMVKTITNGKGGIIETGSQVSTLGAKFQILKNKVLVALEPIATKIVELGNKYLAGLIRWIDKSGGLAAIFEKWKVPILAVVAAFGLLYAPMLTIATGLVLLYQHNQRFRDIVQAVAGFIQTKLVPAFQDVGKWIQTVALPALQQFGDYLQNTVWPIVQQVAGYIAEQFQHLVAAVRSRWADIQAAIHTVLTAIKIEFLIFIGPILFIWKHFHSEIENILKVTWTTIRTLVQAALKILTGIIDVALGLLSGDWGRAWDGIKEIFAGAWDALVGIFKQAWAVFKQAFVIAWDTFLAAMTNLPGAIIRALGDVVGAFATVGAAIVKGIVAGIVNSGDAITNALKDKLPGPLKSLPGFEKHILSAEVPGVGALFSGARGGFVNFPTSGAMALLHGRELILPLNDRNRSLALLGQSGLFGAGGGAPGGIAPGRAPVTVILAPQFPPGMNEQQMMEGMRTLVVTEVAGAIESVGSHTVVGAGRSR